MDTVVQAESLEAVLRPVWERLAVEPEGYLCTRAARECRAIVGGEIMGYQFNSNPTAQLGESESGHDFLVVGGFIVDCWSADYYGNSAILHLERDAADVRRLYGDSAKWEKVEV